MKRAWKITKGHQDYTEDCVGVSSVDWDETMAQQATMRFRMRDDDNIIYVSGVCTPDVDFEPLDDYGMGALGCTSIEFFEGGSWKPL